MTHLGRLRGLVRHPTRATGHLPLFNCHCHQLFVITLKQTAGGNHMTFRFAAQYGLLTYAQSGELDPFRVVDHLGNLGAECIIGRESHSDGGLHLHAFFMFERKFESVIHIEYTDIS